MCENRTDGNNIIKKKMERGRDRTRIKRKREIAIAVRLYLYSHPERQLGRPQSRDKSCKGGLTTKTGNRVNALIFLPG